MFWHVLSLGAVLTCAWLASWQWGKAGSAMGSALNIGYGLQWPVFAVFFAVMWWRMLYLEARRIRAGAAGEQVPAAPAEPVAVANPGPDAGGSPFGRRPARAVAPTTADEDPELAAYNRMLARLAARERPEE